MDLICLQHRGTRFPFSVEPAVLGRSPDCLIVLGARRISREHARIWLDEGSALIRDLDSRNGTRVNGRLILGDHDLADGDIVEIGEERLRFLVNPRADLPETLGIGDNDTDPTALAQRSVLELSEELVMRGATAEDRSAVARTIYSMVCALLESMDNVGQHLSRGECVRLVAVCNVIARWDFELSDLGDWAEDVRRTLVH